MLATKLRNIQLPVADIRVVSIIGTNGKSTFLNAFVHMLDIPKVPPFSTQCDIHNCEQGIEYYYCSSESILFLDCHGIHFLDIAYKISDVIILNEYKILNNDSLKVFEPICNLQTTMKPHLLFRIADCDVLTDHKSNLARILMKRDDPYQSLRDTIMRLFQPTIGIVKTDVMSKVARAAVLSNNYSMLFREPSNGFSLAINEILAFLPKGRPSTTWIETVRKVTTQPMETIKEDKEDKEDKEEKTMKDVSVQTDSVIPTVVMVKPRSCCWPFWFKKSTAQSSNANTARKGS